VGAEEQGLVAVKKIVEERFVSVPNRLKLFIVSKRQLFGRERNVLSGPFDMKFHTEILFDADGQNTAIDFTAGAE
jgi:hypothetical protein